MNEEDANGNEVTRIGQGYPSSNVRSTQLSHPLSTSESDFMKRRFFQSYSAPSSGWSRYNLPSTSGGPPLTEEEYRAHSQFNLNQTNGTNQSTNQIRMHSSIGLDKSEAKPFPCDVSAMPARSMGGMPGVSSQANDSAGVNVASQATVVATEQESVIPSVLQSICGGGMYG